jgi:hypothetical protein
MQKILRDPKKSAEVQIADVNFVCWAMVDAAMKLQAAVFDELRDTE